MKNILIINASARRIHSHSRTLAEVFIKHWRDLHSNTSIHMRELGEGNVPHINEAWITANVKSAAHRTEKDVEILSASDAYIEELKQANIIVLATPMYNWSIPSVLKAYVDQVMRLNETFLVNPGDAANPYTGLLQNKTLVLLVARGASGYEAGEQHAHLNFQTTYLKTVFNLMGITDIRMVAVDGTSFDKERLKNTIEEAHQQVRSVIEGME